MALSRATEATAAPYDPLALPDWPLPAPLDLTVVDATRRREIPLRLFLPAVLPTTSDAAMPAPTAGPAPVVMFSHGLGSTREGNPHLGRQWAGRGYAVVFMQHAGCDDPVWRDSPPAHCMAALRAAANLRNTLRRLQDAPAVINPLARWPEQRGLALAGRLDLARLGMSGHSLGAVTTQAVSGQRNAQGAAAFTDPRIRAAVVMSPNAPRHGLAPAQAFGEVTLPWLLMTGTRDVAVVGDADLASRLAVYPALPAGGKYELVLDAAEHDAFGDYPLRSGQPARNPAHHPVILALSTAFWNAWLRGDASARAWLDGPQARALLAPTDRWQRK